MPLKNKINRDMDRKLDVVKVLIIPKLIHKFIVNSIKILVENFKGLDKLTHREE